METLKGILAGAKGNCAAYIRMRIGGRSETVIALGESWQVAANDELLVRLERVFGERVATLS